jgi:hypothetical protein
MIWNSYYITDGKRSTTVARSRLWVAGDSFGMFDRDDSRPNWIRMLADQLGLDEIKNYSRGGADNDMIYYVAESIIKNWNWPGRNEIPFNKETDYLLYLSTTNTRGWMRTDIFDEREWNQEISIANLEWWVHESNGKLIEEYDQFPKPLIYGQNYNSLICDEEDNASLHGNNKDLVNRGNPDAVNNEKARVTEEVSDIIANYILVTDVDYTRKLNNTRMYHMMGWYQANGYKTLFGHHDMSPHIADTDIVSMYPVIEHPTDWDDCMADGESEQANHLTDSGHESYYNDYLKQRVDDIINTWGWK